MPTSRYEQLDARAKAIVAELNELMEREKKLWTELDKVNLEIKAIEKLGWTDDESQPDAG